MFCLCDVCGLFWDQNFPAMSCLASMCRDLTWPCLISCAFLPCLDAQTLQAASVICMCRWCGSALSCYIFACVMLLAWELDQAFKPILHVGCLFSGSCASLEYIIRCVVVSAMTACSKSGGGVVQPMMMPLLHDMPAGPPGLSITSQAVKIVVLGRLTPLSTLLTG